jgi:hypothetical protein
MTSHLFQIIAPKSRQSSNRNQDYLPQRRKGRREDKTDFRTWRSAWAREISESKSLQSEFPRFAQSLKYRKHAALLSHRSEYSPHIPGNFPPKQSANPMATHARCMNRGKAGVLKLRAGKL